MHNQQIFALIASISMGRGRYTNHIECFSSSLHRVLSVELPGTVVFDYPTIGALAAYAAMLCQHQQPAESASALVPASAVPRSLAVLDR